GVQGRVPAALRVRAQAAGEGARAGLQPHRQHLRRFLRQACGADLCQGGSMSEVINVEVIYAHPHRHELVKLVLPEGATVEDAVKASGLLEKHPEISLDGENKVGIFSKLTKLDTPLRD